MNAIVDRGMRIDDFILADDDPALVGSAGWTSLIPEVHRALAGTRARFPNPRGNAPERQPFWEAACYLMWSLLGWSDPGRGLQWWYRRSQETDGDPRLELLKTVWGSHPDFDSFAAWMWAWGQRGEHGSLLKMLGAWSCTATRSGELTDFLGSQWSRPVVARSQAAPLETIYSATSANELHLGPSCEGVESRAELIRSSVNERRAVLLVDRASGWYRTLMRKGSPSQDPGDRSWHVDVVVKPLGWLGTFRRSRDTGLWFLGTHSIHKQGQSLTKPISWPPT